MVIVVAIVIGPLIVDVHVHVNATVAVAVDGDLNVNVNVNVDGHVDGAYRPLLIRSLSAPRSSGCLNLNPYSSVCTGITR